MATRTHPSESETPAGDDAERTGFGARWAALRARWWVRWTMDIAIVALVFWAVMAWQTRALVDDGEPAPGFELVALDGQVHDLADYRGRKVVLAFWAPWCGVCDLEASTLSSLQESVDPDEVAVLSVALGWEERAEVEAFVDEHGVDFPVLLGDDALGERYSISSFPTIYVLDEAGDVEHTVVGYTTEAGLRARLW